MADRAGLMIRKGLEFNIWHSEYGKFHKFLKNYVKRLYNLTDGAQKIFLKCDHKKKKKTYYNTMKVQEILQIKIIR